MRRLFLFKLWNKLSYKPFSVYIKDAYYSFEQIAKNEVVFDNLLITNQISYQYYYGYGGALSTSQTIDFKQIDNEINYSKRIELIENGSTYF